MLELLWRSDGDEVVPLLHFHTQLAQLGRHGVQAIGLLHAPVVDIANGGGPLGKQRRGGDGHGRIRNVVHVHVDALERPLLRLDEVVTPGDAGAHLLQHVGEVDVPLDAVLADAGDPHLALDGPRREEVGGAGGIPFHQEVARADIGLVALDVEHFVVVVFDDHPELLHDVQGDVDVGLGDQLTLDVDAGVAGRHGGCHQKRRQELAGDGAVHVHVATPETLGIHHQGRIAVFLQVLDMGTGLAQGIHQVADGTLFHARLAAQGVLTRPQAQGGAEGTHGGAGVAEEQVDRLFHREAATQAVHGALGLVGGELVLHAELGQRRQHVADVIAVEQVGQPGGAARQGGQQQGPVRDTLGARQIDHPGHARNGFQTQRIHKLPVRSQVNHLTGR